MKFILKIFFIAVVMLIIAIITLIAVFGDHTNRTNFIIYSADKKQCVTIITRGLNRYIINGKSNYSIPKTNYVKLDLSNTSRIGDEIGVCWKNENYEWEIVNHKAKVIENKLDTLKFKFNESWDRDEHGIPNSKKYHKPNCGTIGLSNMKTYDETIILEN